MVKKNFTKKDLSIKIYQKLGFSKNFSSLIIDDFFEAINSELIKANKIKLSSFGTLKILSKKERRGLNPKTKSEALISARKVVSFKPSSLFKNKINKT